MGAKVLLRVWRGDAGQGELTDYQVEANEGEVVLDVLHRLQATQTGDLLGIPASGKPVQWNAVDIYRVSEDGKITEQWAFEDMAAIGSQLGAFALPWAG